MTEPMFFAAFFFPSAAVVLVYAMKYLATIAQARAQRGQDEAYREVAAQAAAAQTHFAATLAAQGEALDEIRSRLVRLEAILKEVE